MNKLKKRPRVSGKASNDKIDQNEEDCNMELMDEDMESSDSENDLTFYPNDSKEVADGSDDMNGGEAAAVAGGGVTMDFIFSDPRETHFHSVKQFLLAYLPSSQPFDVSGLANAIVGQVTAGTMVCAEGEDDVYGFITALNIKSFAHEISIQQVLQYVTKKCPCAESPQLYQILSKKTVGLVISERMVNLPYQLVPALHSALHEDIEWAMNNEDTEELRNSFKMDYFLILAACTEEKNSNSVSRKDKKCKTTNEQVNKVYHKFEEEFFEQEAELSFSFEVPSTDRERVGKSSKTTVVLLIERKKHKAALANISAMINA
ncbi:Isoamyl acetate-hydrolyzing esterase and related enzymes [Plasmopara halstedii]|uniref:Isoamyl acetate-hydrolyzing esterase and related enzymes n=1 Tax=Plasmopara halstedii TaxID=4781 RepID=A0A0P1AED7_PLAHL|nr:Isoamyl acetate-hydrolyzing esterase and related enzymes [Plasmopara halstedii]CEG39421.1 Isoamyl acetate-hydrolyzing esterase and related enzymes [Plasmopara halstedii]|eukprot:XP_024575790.1 Isoamyl acetate-hydrolyzing esterase and related enzymes [Plasmopara halstedii]